jgi:hypothetical protein
LPAWHWLRWCIFVAVLEITQSTGRRYRRLGIGCVGTFFCGSVCLNLGSLGAIGSQQAVEIAGSETKSKGTFTLSA